MNLANDVKGRVFDPVVSEKRKNTVMANFSTFEGKDKEGNPKYNSWTIYFVGKSYNAAKELQSKDQVRLLNAKVETSYNKETEKTYVWITAFSFEKMDEKPDTKESEG